MHDKHLFFIEIQLYITALFLAVFFCQSTDVSVESAHTASSVVAPACVTAFRSAMEPNSKMDTAGEGHRPEMRYGSYTEKQGALQKKTKVFSLHKRKRFLRLKGSMLQIMKGEEDGQPEWEVGLQNTEIVGDEGKLEIEIQASHKMEAFVCESRAEYIDWFTALKSASAKSIKDYYGFVKVLGEGHFGRVLLAKDHRTQESFAVKVIRKNKKEVRNATLIQREMDILREVNHKNIVRLYDLFDTETKLYFVLECMKGGVLYEVLAKKHSHFSEERASHVLRDILQGLEYLHSKSIVHRDIKPENILTTAREWPFTSKLADFGLSNMLSPVTGVLDSKVGTPYYCAREVVVNDSYGVKADLWSCGVIAFEMLSGRKPFEGKDSIQVLCAIRDGIYSFRQEEWAHISPEARNFVERLICVDVDRRMSATEALAHPWIVNSGRHDAIRNDLSGLARSSGSKPGAHGHHKDDDIVME